MCYDIFMEIIKARIENLPAIMDVISHAQKTMREMGTDQWQNGYPNQAVLTEDIAGGSCYQCIDNGIVLGVVVLLFEPEECYENISGGEWLTSGEPYGVFHRLAVRDSARNQGVAGKLIEKCKQLCLERGVKSLRADTHRGNLPMQKFLNKSGFQYCGLFDLGRGQGDTIRMAYEIRVI